MKWLLLFVSSFAWAQNQATFDKVKQELLKNYFRGSLTEEEIYQAAIRGLMKELDPELSEWNQYLSPEEYSELHSDLEGKIVGAGVEIRFDMNSGQSEVIHVISGSPAEKAGVKVGDRILSVDGKTYAGKRLREVVSAIRGREKDRRRLVLLRGDQTLSKTLSLTSIPFDEVTLSWPKPDVALLGVNYFTKDTPARVEKLLEKASRAKSLVLDLRGNSGGAFEPAMKTVELFLPQGTAIVQLVKRGEKEEVLRSSRGPAIKDLPLAVLVNEETSCAAEVFASALREQRGATLVGAKTFGKWSMQKVESLGKETAIKYTVGIFRSSKGKVGESLTPDVEVPFDKREVRRVQRIEDPKMRLETDPQLRAAITLL